MLTCEEVHALISEEHGGINFSDIPRKHQVEQIESRVTVGRVNAEWTSAMAESFKQVVTEYV